MPVQSFDYTCMLEASWCFALFLTQIDKQSQIDHIEDPTEYKE